MFWVTAGFLIALWEISGAVRAVMGALNRVYGDETRALVAAADARLDRARRWRVGACLLAAIARRRGRPAARTATCPAGWRVLLFVVRWGVAAGLLLLAVAVLLHYAPERHSAAALGHVRRRADHGSAGCVMSLGFGFYLRDIADYNSIFGGLATVVVLIAYLYARAVVFLGGVQVDALLRR